MSSEPFGSRVRKLRLEHGLTQEELSGMTDISNKYISDIETGKRPAVKLTVGIIEKIAKALDIHPKDLLYPDNC